MQRTLKIATLLASLAGTALAHGYVSGIVTNGVYTEGWQVSFWYDIVNKVPIPQTPGWYEEELDLGFIPPDEYQYVVFFVYIAYRI
jgi:cellulase